MSRTPILKVKIPPLYARGLSGQFKSVSQDVNLVIEVVKNALRPVVQDELKKDSFNIEIRSGFIEIFLSETIASKTLFDNSMSEVLLATFREIQQAFKQYKEIKNNCVELLLVDNSVALERANSICFRSKAAKEFMELHLQSPFRKRASILVIIGHQEVKISFPDLHFITISERRTLNIQLVSLNYRMQLSLKIPNQKNTIVSELSPPLNKIVAQLFKCQISSVDVEADITIHQYGRIQIITSINLISIFVAGA